MVLPFFEPDVELRVASALEMRRYLAMNLRRVQPILPGVKIVGTDDVLIRSVSERYDFHFS